MDWFEEGRFRLEWKLVCLGLWDHMEWEEALILAHTADDLDHKSLCVVVASQTEGEMDLTRELVFQSRRLRRCPFEN